MFPGEIPAPEKPQELPPGALDALLAPGALVCRIGPSAGRSGPSSRAAVGCHGALRWPQRGAAGGRPVRSRADGHCHFWFQVRPRRRRQARHHACGLRAGSGAALLVDSVWCATVQLFAAFRRSWRSLPAASPAPSRAIIFPGRLPWQFSRRKCWRSPPAFGRHPGAQPPDFRAAVPRLSRDVTPPIQLIGVLSTRSFLALADRTIRTAGGDA